MNISSKKYQIELDTNELYTLFCALRNYHINSVETHWKNHQDSYKSNDVVDFDMAMLRKMAMALDQYHQFESIAKDVKEIFSQKLEK